VPPVAMSSESLSMRHRWFTCVRLSNPYMTCLITPFNRNVRHRNVSDCSSLRLFEVCACTPASEGLPPSQVQHRVPKERGPVHGTAPPRLLTSAAGGDLRSAPESRSRGAYPHRLCSYTLSNPFGLLRARGARRAGGLPCLAPSRGSATRPAPSQTPPCGITAAGSSA
jgi:hypothetical protein